ncbi:MAG: hypothetical protein DRQ01_08565 [Ignavibacteriae bacterium]|nr:MAG: hypothetical protein DRQ01_08565 [Ignavibacteriota bacterium]
MKTFILILSFLVAVLCSCTQYVEPDDPEPESKTLIFTSFESDGNASLSNWVSPGPPVVKFATDVPPNGGKYSIFLKAREIGAYVYTTVPALEGTHNYRLTFWSKSTEDPGSLEIYLKQDGNKVDKKREVIRTAEWTSFIIETEFTASVGDSIEVMLVGSLYIIPQGFNYFDLIKLVNLD